MRYDKKSFESIAKSCGEKSALASVSYVDRLRRAGWDRGKTICWEADGDGFILCVEQKTHLRWFQIAVRKEAQGKGVGAGLVWHMIKYARARGFDRITFLTKMPSWYNQFGAQIVGKTNEEYKMEIVL